MSDTHFGFRQVPLADKQALVDDVFHRAWKDDLVNAINVPKGPAPFSLLDVAGGTGDIAFRAIDAGGSGTRVTAADIHPEMLAVGRARAAERGYDDVVSFVEANAEALPFPDRSHDAYSIAFGIRNVPRLDRAL